MLWKSNKKDNFIMVYGFKKQKRIYDTVLTLHIKNEKETWVYGFLSKCRLSVKDFISLWKYLKQIVPTQYLMVEAFSMHTRIYKMFLPIIKVERTKTFNGFESETLQIVMKKPLRNMKLIKRIN